jgi:hypothetical protein
VRELVAKDGNDQNEILLLDASGEPEKENWFLQRLYHYE